MRPLPRAALVLPALGSLPRLGYPMFIGRDTVVQEAQGQRNVADHASEVLADVTR